MDRAFCVKMYTTLWFFFSFLTLPHTNHVRLFRVFEVWGVEKSVCVWSRRRKEVRWCLVRGRQSRDMMWRSCFFLTLTNYYDDPLVAFSFRYEFSFFFLFCTDFSCGGLYPVIVSSTLRVSCRKDTAKNNCQVGFKPASQVTVESPAPKRRPVKAITKKKSSGGKLVTLAFSARSEIKKTTTHQENRPSPQGQAIGVTGLGFFFHGCVFTASFSLLRWTLTFLRFSLAGIFISRH